MNLLAIQQKLKSILSFLEKNKKLLFILALLIAFVLIYFLNYLTPLIADDFYYLYSFGVGYPKPIDSLSELIISQSKHYEVWGGRVVTHAIGQVLLQFPSFVFDILNAIVYFLYISLLYKIIVGKTRKFNYLLFMLLFFAVWYVTPTYGDTMLWLIGSANYLWGTTIILLYLLPYRLWTDTKKTIVKSSFYSILLFLLGIVVGWTNENSVAALIVILVLLVALYFNKMHNKPYPLLFGIIGVCIGYYFLITAPGNFIRAGENIRLSFFILFYRFYRMSTNLFTMYGWMLIIVCAFFFYAFKKKLKVHYTLIAIFVIGAFVGVYVMLASPQFPPRSWFIVVTFLIIAIGLFLQEISNVGLRMIKYSVVLISAIGFIFTYITAVKDGLKVKQMTQERELLAKTARDNGEVVVVFERINLGSRYVHDEDDRSNMVLDLYYGLPVEFEKE